jgi:hypothetical protein
MASQEPVADAAAVALAEMETALYAARPDAPERLQPGRVGDAVRNAERELSSAGVPHDRALFEAVARRWERGYPADIEYQADLRDLEAEALRATDELRRRRAQP